MAGTSLPTVYVCDVTPIAIIGRSPKAAPRSNLTVVLRAAMVTPLSGPLAGYGRAGAAALELWAGQFAGRPAPRLSAYDAHPDAATAVRHAERDGFDLLFGPYGSGSATAAAAATQRLMWNHGGARLAPARNVVSVLAPATRYFDGTVQVVARADPTLRRVAVVGSGTGFARAVCDGAQQSARGLGLAVWRAALPADRVPEAELLLVAGAFQDERDAAQLLLPGRWRAAGFVGAGVEEILAGIGTLREGLLGPAQWLASAATDPDLGPPAAGFVAAYRRRTGVEPPYPAAQAFAAGLIADRCVGEAGSMDREALLAAAHRLDCVTLFGRFRLDSETGEQAGHQVLTVQWQDAARVVVWPPGRAQASLRHPLERARARG
jgi:branched-chain amino acid transport system substrate-binding protein